MVRAALVAGIVLLVGPGCAQLRAIFAPADTTGSVAAAPVAAAAGSAATWQLPTELATITEAADMRGAGSIVVWIPNTGYVRGTPDAIASLGRPLAAASGRNRTVEPCRTTVRREAAKLGARDVEAVSAGRDDQDDKGRIFAPVAMRITYDVPGGYEVRLATLTCVVDRNGTILEAYS